MGYHGSIIGDTSNGVIPSRRMSLPLYPCLRGLARTPIWERQR